MKRIKLRDRLLPDYTKGEEIMNMVTHIVGGGLAVVVLILCSARAFMHGNGWDITGAIVYGISMLWLYAMSSIYHGMRAGTGKKVLQILDHCTIYILIAGTYTPILLSGFRPVYPGIAWGLIFFQWGLAALAVTLTAIDLKRYNIFSMICYICMGWAILPFIKQSMHVLTSHGFYWLLSGGIAYTIGAILYGIGSKKRWFHSVFHIFVVLGSFLQFISIFFFVL